MNLCVRDIDFFLSTTLMFDFGIVPTVWYFRIVPTVWYFRIVPTVWYFRIVPTVWYFRIVPTVWFRQCGILEMFRQCGIFCFLIDYCNKMLEQEFCTLVRTLISTNHCL